LVDNRHYATCAGDQSCPVEPRAGAGAQEPLADWRREPTAERQTAEPRTVVVHALA
jgi:hypothetical protein